MRLLFTAVLSLGLHAMNPAISAANAAPGGSPGSELADAVSRSNLVRHLRVFQDIADRNGGNRAAGTSGFDESAEYVQSQLTAAGYQVVSDPFEFMYFKELAPAQLKLTVKYPANPLSSPFNRHSAARKGTGPGTASDPNGSPATGMEPEPGSAIKVTTLRFSGSGRVRGPVRDAGTGCRARGFAAFQAGEVAKVVRGICTIDLKVKHAVAAGAVGVVIVNDREGDLRGGLTGPRAHVPVVGVRKQDGDLRGYAEIVTSTLSERRVTRNLIVQTPQGRTDEVIMVGAHLDSVQEGPGINDNGSGSAAVLELALRMRQFRPDRAVRFVWWGAEELGLLGSKHYVGSLPQQERENIGLYLNLDMIASPNSIYGIFDGDDSDRVGEGPGPRGSDDIERTFQAFYDSRGLPHTGVDFTGRSDYGPFIEAGIPAGGVFTGADAQKTAEQAAQFGGVPGKPLDPCYHLACDTIKNIHLVALDVNADAIAHAVAAYAFQDR
ncbi:M28 family metallopeptidase [Acrocarpospora macrocephala]|uniref:Amidohydrolase n=1 Tax=Acrocarpospora macrocephala TaxID=150177 RepID=A0A5M3X2Y2_9ACTN|nr:M28 family metallopeptidase [Acrocarpospora macrocephala]GES16097.1 amidohydrolase [Acrocarpospora macrocephala]